MTSSLDQLSQRQRHLLQEWLPGCAVVRDHSWGLGTTVLEVVHAGERYVVKAGDEKDGQIAREVRAHRDWVGVWVTLGRAPRLLHADAGAKVLVTRYLPGVLVQGTDVEQAAGTYRQAGELLARFHRQFSVVDDDFEARTKARALWWLDRPHRIPAQTEGRLRELVASWPTPPTVVVPTHGDWQPRNWLIEDGVVRVIDFGKVDLRVATTDFARLSAQQFRGRPELEAAFFGGYGPWPGDAGSWQRVRVRAAIGTAAWAHQVGEVRFERQGLRMIDEALEG